MAHFDLKKFVIESEQNYILVIGLNHERFIGMDKETGEVRNFDIRNREYYRAPLNKAEEEKCYQEAKRYYDSCIKRCKIDEFSAKPIAEYLEDWALEEILNGIS